MGCWLGGAGEGEGAGDGDGAGDGAGDGDGDEVGPVEAQLKPVEASDMEPVRLAAEALGELGSRLRPDADEEGVES